MSNPLPPSYATSSTSTTSSYNNGIVQQHQHQQHQHQPHQQYPQQQQQQHHNTGQQQLPQQQQQHHSSSNSGNNNHHTSSSSRHAPGGSSSGSRPSHTSSSSSSNANNDSRKRERESTSTSSSSQQQQQHKRPSSSSAATSSSQSSSQSSQSSRSSSDFNCSMKLTNNLPDTPFDPKFLTISTDLNRFALYKTTSLEKNYKYPLLTEPNLGISIELIDPVIYNTPKTKIEVPKEDLPLLKSLAQQDSESKRLSATRGTATNFVRPAVSWLRKTEYLSSNENSMGRGVKRASTTQSTFKEDLDVQLAENTFDAINNQSFVHPTNPNAKPVSVLPVFPDFELWGNEYTEVQFDADPLDLPPSNLKSDSFQQYIQRQQEIRSKGIIKGIRGKFVYFIAPKNELDFENYNNNNNNNNNSSSSSSNKNNGNENIDDGNPYRMYKVFTHDIFPGQEENFFLIDKGDALYYNKMSTKVSLKKVKSRDDKIREKRNIGKPEYVTYDTRSMTIEEIENQEKSISTLLKEEKALFSTKSKSM
ncbi:hypothetical protein SAMD00019534_050520 [Acytostelium subglobosum LB1]|uniref:hypothetical protein n=1 Tax=Acytostelium subglobosum LB1 TaxID=1410327 RepID=UPI000644E649|nr:hypothetical protein SAMD00019534_050520 [Acytostelium subglobosum LB1]GAM21877.1 hypothetical protein SAMD00019534_050520 [Acytostelium subglobosum LB1]|eukprot:XP_012754977.1 hypothetical protein SAMD00019534_050520 [Acytostelium subglobosum LB1]